MPCRETLLHENGIISRNKFYKMKRLRAPGALTGAYMNSWEGCFPKRLGGFTSGRKYEIWHDGVF